MQKRLFWLFALFAFGFAAAGNRIRTVRGVGYKMQNAE